MTLPTKRASVLQHNPKGNYWFCVGKRTQWFPFFILTIMTEWFKHDYKARTHPTMQRILMKWDWNGIGVYWALIEMLYENDGRLELSECESYAFALRLDSEWLAKFIKECNAFEFDGDIFYSTTVHERLESRGDISQKRSNSAKKRWDNANALQPDSKSNAIREEKSREEENREEKNVKRKRFTAPTFDEVKLEMGDDLESEKFIDFYASKGWKVGKNPMVDWKASVRTWKRNSDKFNKPKAKVDWNGWDKPLGGSTRETLADYGSSVG